VCEALSNPPDDDPTAWWVQTNSTRAAKALIKAFGTPVGSDPAFNLVKLPEQLGRFMDAYSRGLYPKLTSPSDSDLRNYELQSELDARDFAAFRRRLPLAFVGFAFLVLAVFLLARLLR
jgi:hypothetical protein